MKSNHFLKKHIVAIVALLFAVAIMSFKVIEKKYAGVYYYYNDPATSSFNILTRWTKTDPGETCKATGVRPCKVEVNEADGETLNDVIGGKSDTYIMNSVARGQKN